MTTDATETGVADTGTETGIADTGSETGVADTGTETGVVVGCGWDLKGGFYACGGDGEDPDGANPIACPDGLVEGEACGDLTDIGCCADDGSNPYCLDGTVVIEVCL